jgi:hypothetical protein
MHTDSQHYWQDLSGLRAGLFVLRPFGQLCFGSGGMCHVQPEYAPAGICSGRVARVHYAGMSYLSSAASHW